VNGVGDVPSYYGLEDMTNPASITGRESEPSGWMSPEVLIMSIVDERDLKNLMERIAAAEAG
jgi:hypothetical protein